jgi:Endosomal/lysosomal potassium channel TMEM175
VCCKIAIILTIMVLELKVPHEPTLAALRPLAPVFLSYVISFIVIGIYWNNHHHLFQAVQYINGRVMWANLHLLFWLSLIPFVTAWTGENNFVSVQRTDKYGGSILHGRGYANENRARLLMEITAAVVGVWGGDSHSERLRQGVGIKLGASNTYDDMADSNPVKLFSYVVETLNQFDLALQPV